jgi:hypothetical protein
MKNENGFPRLLERFFTQRLIAQRRVSPRTIASYRDTFDCCCSSSRSNQASRLPGSN